ncbi:MAG: CidA/LrgA family protein [Eubacteriales bacterium]|nr:CidA/LrgA family protein [Eubacteriales bacterium]
MKYLKQLLIIVFIAYIGETLNYFIPLPIPGSIYGLMIMFLALNLGILKVEQVSGTARYLLEIMPVMFIAPAAKLVSSWDVVKNVLWQGTLISVVTTVAGMAIVGKVTQAVIRGGKKTAAANAGAGEGALAAGDPAPVEGAEEKTVKEVK